MAEQPIVNYLQVCKRIRSRFDHIDVIKNSGGDVFSAAETTGMNVRKIIESIAFGCLIAVENGMGNVPRDARGQWNAAIILKNLEKKDFGVAFPSPSIIRPATPKEMEKNNVKAVIEGVKDYRITREALLEMYTRSHIWNHEINPYVRTKGEEELLNKYAAGLYADVDRLWHFVAKHVISINGKAFYCALKDNNDGQVKILDLQKVEEIKE